jgi:hypothetical protein
MTKRVILIAAFVCTALPIAAIPATDVPVPASCTPAVNAELATLVTDGSPRELDNVMVCGVATRATYFQRSRGYAGSHHVTSVSAPISTGGSILVQIVTNDSLDGIVTAQAGDAVYALGQFYQTTERQRPYAAGIHDTHCATHRGADNGWVVVNAKRWPAHC